MAEKYVVTQGPSKFDLMLALFDRGEGGDSWDPPVGHQVRTVIFFLAAVSKDGFVGRDSFQVTAKVIGVSAINRDAESWEIVIVEKNGRRLTGEYQTNTRHGVLYAK